MNISLSYNSRVNISLFLVSISIISLQIVLIQILSIVHWYHFAYMVISVALLGFGASGTFISLFRKWLLEHFQIFLPISIILFGLSTALLHFLSNSVVGHFDSFLLFRDKSQIILLVLNYIIFFLPFFFGATSIGLIFIFYVKEIGRLYFINLVGSGLGGLFGLYLIWIFFPVKILSIISFIGLIGGLLLLPLRMHPFGESKYEYHTIWKVFISVLAFISFLVCLASLFFTSKLNLSEYKSISKSLNLPNSRVVFEESSPYGFLQVVSSPHFRYAPGISLTYDKNFSVQRVFFNNGDWIGPLLKWTQKDDYHILDFTTNALPYKIGDNKNILILNSATGVNLSHALSHHPKKVVVVEPNSKLINLLKNEYAREIDSMYWLSNVEIHNLESRTFLLTNREKFDLVIFPTVETFGGSSGLYAIRENYLMTIESFKKVFGSLKEDGLLTITSWLDHPPRASIRILSTIVSTMHEMKIENPIKHIAAIKSWGTITFVVKKNELASNDLQRIRLFCNQMLFDPVIMPDITPTERSKFNSMQSDLFFELIDEVLSESSEIQPSAGEDYAFHINSTTDDKPYFSQFLKLNQIKYLQNFYDSGTIPYLELGYLIVVITFFQICILSIVLIFLPLLKFNIRGSGKIRTLLYFGGIGIGYMFIEIIFIQRFLLYFGNQIYSTAFVLSALLISSGIGSYFSSKIKTVKQSLLKIFGMICVLILIMMIVLNYLIYNTIGLNDWIKVILSLLIISPLGFFMGIPFPTAIKKLSIENENLIPWAWGVNGCTSVISTIAATIIAIEFGYNVVLFSAFLAYLIGGTVILTSK